MPPPQQQQSTMNPIFDNFMSNCIADPDFFESVKNIYLMAKVQTNSSSNANNSGPVYQSQPNLMKGSSVVNEMKF